MLGFEREDVLVYRGQRSELETVGDFFVARTVSVLLQKSRQEIEKFLLAFRKCHVGIVRRKKSEPQSLFGMNSPVLNVRGQSTDPTVAKCLTGIVSHLRPLL